MTKGQLANGIFFKHEIERIESWIEDWNSAEKFHSIHARDSNDNQLNLNWKVLDFDLIKTLALSTLQKELARLQKEFDSL